MKRSRLSKENVGSSIPRVLLGKRRSSSLDCADRRGSYLPTRRNSSAERFRTPLKSSSSTPRMSGSCLRPSMGSAFVDRKPRVTKDPRPLADKAYQRKCIVSLINFLSEKNFPYQITPNSLMSPQKRDYELIFQFLYKMVDSRYEVRRIEEEVPRLLKELKYPFIVTRSSVLSMNRMSWPALLGTLMWLMHFIQASSITVFGAEPEADETDADLLANYVLQRYKVGDEDSDGEEENEVFRTLCRMKFDVNMSERELEAKIEELQSCVEKEAAKQRDYESLVEQIKNKEQNIQSYQEYICKMQPYLEQKEASLKSTMDEQAEKESVLHELKKAVIAKEALYKAQGFDGQHALNFYSVQKRTLQEKLDEVQKLHKEEEKIIWDMEINLCEMKDKFDGQCKEFNHLWENLRNMSDNAFKAPETIRSLPAVAKLCRDAKINIPEFSISTGYEEDVTPILGKVKNLISQQLDKVADIDNTLDRQVLELETEICNINAKQEIISAKLDEKNREQERKSRDGNGRIEALKNNLCVLEEKLDKVCAKNENQECTIGCQKKKLEEIKTKYVATMLKLEKIKDDCRLYLEKGEQVISDSIKKALADKAKATAAVNLVLEKLKKK